MRQIAVPYSEKKLRLLAAAEQLFAERGIESVSVRDVAKLAKANVAAVNYHFGTREGLIGLVVSRYLGPANDERLVRLETLEKKWGKSVPLEEVLDAYVRPLLGLARKSELSDELMGKLLGRILSQEGTGMPQVIDDQMRQINGRFARALGKALPMLAADDLAWRMHFLVGALIHLLLNQAPPQGRLVETAVVPSLEARLSRFLRFAVCGLREGIELESIAKNAPQSIFDF